MRSRVAAVFLALGALGACRDGPEKDAGGTDSSPQVDTAPGDDSGLLDSQPDSGGDTGCTPSAWYNDADEDGWGAGDPTMACEAPTGAVPTAGDCDDTDPTVYPGAPEADGDDVDSDCDGEDPCPMGLIWKGDIRFGPDDAQAEMEAFCAAGYTEVEGTLRVGSDAEGVDLTALDCVCTARGLEIVQNPYLESLAGLEGLRGLEYVEIVWNPRLSTLRGFPEVTELPIWLYLDGNNWETADYALDVSALRGLERVERVVLSQSIAPSPDGTEPFAGLVELGYLYWGQNGQCLPSRRYDGFGALEQVTDTLKLLDQDCTSLRAFENVRAVQGWVILGAPLVEFAGFPQLTEVGGVSLDYGDDAGALHDFTGFEAVEQINLALTVANTDGMTSFDGLSSLRRIEGDLMVRENLAFADVSELYDLEYIAGCVIEEENPAYPGSIEADLRAALGDENVGTECLYYTAWND